jgi:4-amino-4-deoxy-L-arabinose transferase-like glycosyltransferase
MPRSVFDRLSVVHWTLVLWVLAFALALAAGLLLPSSLRQPSTDYIRYYAPRAEELLTGSGLLDPAGQVYTRYPPGYPLVLATMFALSDLLRINEALLLALLAAVCAGCSAGLLYQTAALAFGARSALIAGAAWAFYPFALWTTAGAQIEAVYLPVVFAAVYALARAMLRDDSSLRAYVLVGALVGLAMLLRPAALAVGAAVLVAVLMWGGRRRVAQSLALLVTSMLVIAPWLCYVYAVNGVVIPLGSGGLPSIVDGLTFAVRPSDEREPVELPEGVVDLQTRLYQQLRASADDPAGVIIRELAASPGAALQLGAIKAVRSWYATDSRRYELVVLLAQGAALLVVAGAAWRILRCGTRDMRRLLALVLLFTLSIWLSTTAVLSILRYMLPAMGLLFCLLPAYSSRLARSDAMVASSTPAASRT